MAAATEELELEGIIDAEIVPNILRWLKGIPKYLSNLIITLKFQNFFFQIWAWTRWIRLHQSIAVSWVDRRKDGDIWHNSIVYTKNLPGRGIYGLLFTGVVLFSFHTTTTLLLLLLRLLRLLPSFLPSFRGCQHSTSICQVKEHPLGNHFILLLKSQFVRCLIPFFSLWCIIGKQFAYIYWSEFICRCAKADLDFIICYLINWLFFDWGMLVLLNFFSLLHYWRFRSTMLPIIL